MAKARSLMMHMHGESATTSRSAPVKFLCSHGGTILPPPADARLKYVGGETRVISVPRDITFPELMKKLTSSMCKASEMVLKYQLKEVADDVDDMVLITVKCDEDIRHMFEECDRQHEGAPRLRAFLFPLATDHHSVQKTYVNSVHHPPPESNTFTPFPAASTHSKPVSSLTRNHSSPSLGCNSVTSHHHHSHQSANPPLDRHPHRSSGDPEHLGKLMRSTDRDHNHKTENYKGGHMLHHQREASPYDDYDDDDDYYGNCRTKNTPQSPSVSPSRLRRRMLA